jgi:choline dehydrogenase
MIDAGPDYPQLGQTPDDLVNGHHNSVVDHDWGLEHTPTDQGRTRPQPRGRVTGGSTAVNTAIALRGLPEDFDKWAALGNPGWDGAGVLPHFNDANDPQSWGAGPQPMNKLGRVRISTAVGYLARPGSAPISRSRATVTCAGC